MLNNIRKLIKTVSMSTRQIMREIPQNINQYRYTDIQSYVDHLSRISSQISILSLEHETLSTRL